MTLSTCLGCGCACDDIELRIEADRIVEAGNACLLGARWFGDGRVSSRALVRGRDVSVEDALTAAAMALQDSSRVLVLLAPDISCEAQRATIALADALHAAIDSVTSATALDSVLAAQEIGRASATLGEIRNRADLVVFWGVDPSARYPRFWTRYAPDAAGTHVAGGRQSRTVVAVDVGNARGPEDADLRVSVSPEQEVATLTAWRAAVLASGRALSEPPFVQAMMGASYAAIVVDAEPEESTTTLDAGRSAALIALAQQLNSRTRCALISLRAGGNRSGADSCLTAQTGYPVAVDFARGYPRYRPHERAGERLARGAVDAVLVVGSAALIPPRLLTDLATVPAVAIGPRASQGPFAQGAAAIDTGVVGIHESGTALRMDDVPLPLQKVVSGPPATAAVVQALVARLTPVVFARAAANRQ